MTNSTRFIGLLIAAALWVGGAAAQGPPPSEWADELPPDYSLPSTEGVTAPTLTVPDATDGSIVVPPAHQMEAPFEGYDPEGYSGLSPDGHQLWGGPPAPIESTGTWFRRGFWYAEADAVIWNRLWNRDDRLMAAEDQQVNSPTFFSRVTLFPILNTNRVMFLESAHPGRDGSVRATLGHFMFRDARNRDHTAEFTAFGGGEWEQERVMTSIIPFGLQVPFYIDGFNRSFDNSSRQEIDYESDFASFETNYRVKSRPRRDQMIMDANGNWHRVAHGGLEREYLVGLRFFELSDLIDWRAEDLQGVVGDDGSYVIEANNDLFGFQMGTGLTYQAPRWSLGANCRGGVFLNRATGHTVLNFTADDNNDAENFLAENELSFICDFKLLARWHVTPSISLRGAYEIMYLESVAMAPYQANFVPETAFLNTTGDPFYHGASFGVEGYW